MNRRPPRSTRTYTLFPYTTLFRSLVPSCHWVSACTAIGAGHEMRYNATSTGVGVPAWRARQRRRPSATSPLVDSTTHPSRDQEMRRIPDRLACRSLGRSEEHTSELQSLMRISYAVFCLKKKKTNH